ncbi:MAG: hypothetical protein RL701_1963 [Pseudomonadota bacterium]|jgi:phage shock protein A
MNLFDRFFRVLRASFGAELGLLEGQNAEALLELEREELCRSVANYNRGLAGYAALCERTRLQLAKLGQEQNTLQARLATRLSLSDRQTAGRLALRLEEIAEQCAVLSRELGETEATYAELTRARDLTVAAARDKLAALKRGIRELETQRALADLSEFTAGMHAASSGSGETDGAHARLERLLERVEERRALAFGRARVAQEGLALRDLRMLEADRTELAERALARFEAGTTPRLTSDIQSSQITKIVS